MKRTSLIRPLRLAIALVTLMGVAPLSGQDSLPPSGNDSATEKYRIVWVEDPTTRATIAWNQLSGQPGAVHYGTEDRGRDFKAYPKRATTDRVTDFDEMKNCFVRLEDLEPDTIYFFCIRDEKGVSPRFHFRTAPAEPRPFIFIAGGDSRNFRDVRVAANMFVSKLRPLFVAFTGDMINRDNAASWQGWLDDWQETIAEDGRLTPLVPHRGNHEGRPFSIPTLFDTPDDTYYAFSIGGDLFRYYTLNSQIPAGGKQLEWLRDDLSQHSGSTTHLVAGYHKPMRPHVSRKSEGKNPMKWADSFYHYGLDLALESDSHVMKRTRPLRPDPAGDEGFSPAPDDPRATVFIGEGCWGAPLRPADDSKSWTIAADSFNGLDWIRVSPEGIRIKTVKVEKPSSVESIDGSRPFANPAGLTLWEAGGEPVLTIPAD